MWDRVLAPRSSGGANSISFLPGPRARREIELRRTPVGGHTLPGWSTWIAGAHLRRALDLPTTLLGQLPDPARRAPSQQSFLHHAVALPAGKVPPVNLPTAERTSTIHLTVRETEDVAADVSFLADVRKLFDPWPGSDRVRVRIRTRDGGTTKMHWNAEASRALRIEIAQLLRSRAGFTSLGGRGRVLEEQVEANLRRGRSHFNTHRASRAALRPAERSGPPPTLSELQERASRWTLEEEWAFGDIRRDAKGAYLRAFGSRRATEEHGDSHVEWNEDYPELFEDATTYGRRTAWAWTE